jgi:N-methylhydantoinase B
VLRDVAWGKVSVAGARDDYGVVVGGPPDSPAVDEPASDTLRSARRAARAGAEPFFDRGPGYAMLAGKPSADIDQPDGVG